MLKEKKHKKRINMIVANLVRLTLIIAFIIGCVTGDHSQDFIIVITFLLTFYPSILAK